MQAPWKPTFSGNYATKRQQDQKIKSRKPLKSTFSFVDFVILCMVIQAWARNRFLWKFWLENEKILLLAPPALVSPSRNQQIT